MLNTMSMKQPLKSLYSGEGDKKFSKMPVTLYDTACRGSLDDYILYTWTDTKYDFSSGGGRVSVSGILVEETTEIFCAI